MIGCVLIEWEEGGGAGAAFAALLDRLENVSPDVEVVDPSVLFVDFGIVTEVTKAHQLAKHLGCIAKDAKNMRSLRIGIASGRFVAHAAATGARSGHYSFVTPGTERAFLESTPIGQLPLKGEALRKLELLGFRTVADVAQVNPKEWTSLFGQLGLHLATLARGEDVRPLVPRKLEPQFAVSKQMDFPTPADDQLLSDLGEGLQQLCRQLESAQRLATSVEGLFEQETGAKVRLTLHFASPTWDAARMQAMLRERCSALQFAHPLVGWELAVGSTVPVVYRQLTFASLRPNSTRRAAVQRVAERLASHPQAAQLLRVVWADRQARLPERRGFLQHLAGSQVRRALYLPRPAQVVADASGYPTWVKTRSGWRSVAQCMERWELEDDWWTSLALHRRYYRVRVEPAGVLCLFHDAHSGRWFRQYCWG